jgi:hypothetical protein
MEGEETHSDCDEGEVIDCPVVVPTCDSSCRSSIPNLSPRPPILARLDVARRAPALEEARRRHRSCRLDRPELVRVDGLEGNDLAAAESLGLEDVRAAVALLEVEEQHLTTDDEIGDAGGRKSCRQRHEYSSMDQMGVRTDDGDEKPALGAIPGIRKVPSNPIRLLPRTQPSRPQRVLDGL